MPERHNCPLSNEDVGAVKSLQERLTDIEISLKDIRDALVGDEFAEGFKQRLEKNTEDVSSLKRVLWIGLGGVGTLSLISTVLAIFRNFITIAG